MQPRLGSNGRKTHAGNQATDELRWPTPAEQESSIVQVSARSGWPGPLDHRGFRDADDGMAGPAAISQPAH